MSDKDKQTVIDARAKNRSGKGNKRQTPDRSSISGINTKLDELQRSISTLSTKSEVLQMVTLLPAIMLATVLADEVLRRAKRSDVSPAHFATFLPL
jgi:hypothetical protein